MFTFFIGEGRLGNQIFQFVAIRKRFGEGVLLTPNLRALEDVFKMPANIRIVKISKAAEKILRRVICPAAVRPLFKWLRLGTYCHESKGPRSNGSRDPSGNMAMRRGWLPVAFVDGGYYQNLADFLAPEDFRCLAVREDVLAAAGAVVDKAMGGRPWPRVVMHVRRGDYLGYSAYGLSKLILPMAYFEQAARAARESLGIDAEILVVSDDPAWCRESLTALAPISVVSGPEAVDFALLTMFPVAILSNSTFSLAAACIGPHIERVIGPEFWFGHSVKRWYPPRIMAHDSRFVYV